MKNFKQWNKQFESHIDNNGELHMSISDNDNDNDIDFDLFPSDILHIMDNEYTDYYKFDWNAKTSEFNDNKDFDKWFKKHKSDMFKKKISSIIKKASEDMILLKRREMSDRKLNIFEELIKPSLSNEVLSDALSKYEENALLDPYATPEMLKKAFSKAKEIIDSNGNIDSSKINKSTLFVGGDINYSKFEEFVKNNPDFQGVFNDWKTLFNENMRLHVKSLNAFRDSTPIDKIRDLRNFLLSYKKTHSL